MNEAIDAPLPERITAWQVQKDGDRSGFWTYGVVAAHNKTDYIRADLYEALQAENARLRGALDKMFDAAQQVHRDGGRELARLVTEHYDG